MGHHERQQEDEMPPVVSVHSSVGNTENQRDIIQPQPFADILGTFLNGFEHRLHSPKKEHLGGIYTTVMQ